MELSQSQIDKIQNIQLKSINDNKEHGFLICDDDIHELNKSKNKENYLDIYLNGIKSIIKNNCKNSEILIGHTHNTGSYNPSNVDFKSNNDLMFLDGFCSAGIDKISCFNKNNQKVFSTSSGKDFDIKFQQYGKIFVGNSLECDKVKKNYKCSINTGKSYKDIGEFNNVGSSGLVNYSKNKDVFISGFDGSDIKCYSNQKNSLFCLNR